VAQPREAPPVGGSKRSNLACLLTVRGDRVTARVIPTTERLSVLEARRSRNRSRPDRSSAADCFQLFPVRVSFSCRCHAFLPALPFDVAPSLTSYFVVNTLPPSSSLKVALHSSCFWPLLRWVSMENTHLNICQSTSRLPMAAPSHWVYLNLCG
jgi:hypothetical protein